MPDKMPAYLAPTFAERKAAREAEEKAMENTEAKAVDAEVEQVENKTVAPTKATRKRKS